MEILYLLVPLSVAAVLLIAALIWRALRFEDLEGPAHRILVDDDAHGDVDEAR